MIETGGSLLFIIVKILKINVSIISFFVKIRNALEPLASEDTTHSGTARQFDGAAKQPVREETEVSFHLASLFPCRRLLGRARPLPVHRPHLRHLPAWLRRAAQREGETVWHKGSSELSAAAGREGGGWEEPVREEAGGEIPCKRVHASHQEEADDCKELRGKHTGGRHSLERRIRNGDGRKRLEGNIRNQGLTSLTRHSLHPA